MCISMVCSHFVIQWKLLIIIIKKQQKMSIQMIIIIISKWLLASSAYILQYAMGSKGLVGHAGGHARIRMGGRRSGPHRKITRYMGRSRSKPPHTPDEISWFRAWGVQFISLECIRTDCLMEDQVTLYQPGAWDWLKMMAFTWLR